eukprot:366387-Chlamydomonas_euryale.AAC.31
MKGGATTFLNSLLPTCAARGVRTWRGRGARNGRASSSSAGQRCMRSDAERCGAMRSEPKPKP